MRLRSILPACFRYRKLGLTFRRCWHRSDARLAPPVSSTEGRAAFNFDAYVAHALKEFDTPGLAIAIVKDGRVVLAKGYGVKRLGDAAPVDAHTLFQIASNTKAFTAAALAILMDEGKLHWDDRVSQYILDSDSRIRTSLANSPSATCYTPSGLGLGAGDLTGSIPITRVTRSCGGSMPPNSSRDFAPHTPTTT